MSNKFLVVSEWCVSCASFGTKICRLLLTVDGVESVGTKMLFGMDLFVDADDDQETTTELDVGLHWARVLYLHGC